MLCNVARYGIVMRGVGIRAIIWKFLLKKIITVIKQGAAILPIKDSTVLVKRPRLEARVPGPVPYKTGLEEIL